MKRRKKVEESLAKSASSSSSSAPCQKGEASAPCQKGEASAPCQKGEATAPCQKGGTAVPCQKELPRWVCVDWFQTIECHELEWQTAGLKRLKDLGVKIWVVSFAGYFQGQRVQDKRERLKEQGLVDHCSIVSMRTGESGKVTICKGWDVKVIFDDNTSICMEAKAAGMEVYQITKKPKYGWPTLDLPFWPTMAIEELEPLTQKGRSLDKRFLKHSLTKRICTEMP